MARNCWPCSQHLRSSEVTHRGGQDTRPDLKILQLTQFDSEAIHHKASSAVRARIDTALLFLQGKLMARARNIKPGFFKNEVLGVADPLYSLLFEGLWVLADRAGRLEDRPLRIKGEVFPYREGIDIDAMLNWLQDNEFIRRYEVDSKRYILVLEFVKHQNPHKNEAESIIPPPDEIGKKPEIIGATRADPGFLIPDSLIADTGAEAHSPARKTKLPKNFAVSDRVRKWAKEKGYERLDEHLEAFIAKCQAKGYTYINWDSGFMEAIREDWAKLRGRGPNGSVPAAEGATVPMNPAALFVPEKPLTPEELERNRARAAEARALLAQATKRMTA
jgi:hypothetical protein